MDDEPRGRFTPPRPGFMIVWMNRLASMLIGMAALTGAAETLLADIPEAPGPIPPNNQPAAWLAWLVAIAIVTVAAVVATKNSKRSHLD